MSRSSSFVSALLVYVGSGILFIGYGFIAGGLALIHGANAWMVLVVNYVVFWPLFPFLIVARFGRITPFDFAVAVLGFLLLGTVALLLARTFRARRMERLANSS